MAGEVRMPNEVRSQRRMFGTPGAFMTYATVMVLVLASTTVWLGAQASQHQTDYERAATALASADARAHAAESGLASASAKVTALTKTVTACRSAITHAIRSMTIASRASVLEVKGGAANTIAAANLLNEAMGSFREGLPDVSSCRGTTGGSG